MLILLKSLVIATICSRCQDKQIVYRMCYSNVTLMVYWIMTTIIYSHPWQGSFNRAILDGIEKLEKEMNEIKGA